MGLMQLKDGQWAFIFQRATCLGGYFNDWEVAGILFLISISVLMLLGFYALIVYLLDLFHARKALEAASRALSARKASLEKVMATFRVFNYGPDDDLYSKENQCPICRDDYEVGQELSCAPCNHVFHYHCLLDSLATSENVGGLGAACPLCRVVLIHD